LTILQSKPELTIIQREGSTALLQFLEDAHRFSLEHHFIADLAPLQLYASALVFAPQSSLIKAAFQHCSPGWLIQPPVTAQTWHTDASRLEAKGFFEAMVFSPDDKYIATCSDDGTVRVWDSETGVCLSTWDASQEHEHWVAVAFSSCNSLAKASFSGVKRTLNIVTFQSIELRDTKEVTCTTLDGYEAKLAFSPSDHDVLYTAVGRRTNDTFTLDLWRLAIGAGTMECIWSRPVSVSQFRVFGIFVELGLVACCPNDSDNLDLLDLDSGAPMRKLKLTSIPVHIGPCTTHGTDLIVALSDYERRPYPHELHCFNVQTGQRHLVESSSEHYETFAMAHRGSKLVLAWSIDKPTEVRNISQDAATRSMPGQDAVLNLTLSADGETLLVVYLDHFEVQMLRGGIVFTRQAIWSSIYGPKISLSHDGAFIAARTCTVKGTPGITLWHIDTGTEVFRPCVTHAQRAPVFSHSAELLAYDDESRRLVIWDILRDTALIFARPPPSWP
jgi:hypothetical protein